MHWSWTHCSALVKIIGIDGYFVLLKAEIEAGCGWNFSLQKGYFTAPSLFHFIHNFFFILRISELMHTIDIVTFLSQGETIYPWVKTVTTGEVGLKFSMRISMLSLSQSILSTFLGLIILVYNKYVLVWINF